MIPYVRTWNVKKEKIQRCGIASYFLKLHHFLIFLISITLIKFLVKLFPCWMYFKFIYLGLSWSLSLISSFQLRISSYLSQCLSPCTVICTFLNLIHSPIHVIEVTTKQYNFHTHTVT